jgi:hypothetical protein
MIVSGKKIGLNQIIHSGPPTSNKSEIDQIYWNQNHEEIANA